MKTKMKIMLAVAAAVIVLIVAGLGVLMFALGPIVKTGIETIGPKVTGTKIAVESVSFNLLKGQIAIKGFVLGNPEGFGTPDSIQAKDVFVDIDPLSLLSSKIHVESIVIDGVALTCEQGLTSNNLTTIKSNVDSFVKSLPGQGAKKETAEAPAPSAKGGKKLQVDKVDISHITVSVALKGVSKDGAGIPVPGITLSDLGSGPEGITPGDLAARILDSLLGGALDAVTPSLKDATAALGKGADAAKEGAGKVVDGAKGALDSVMGVFK